MFNDVKSLTELVMRYGTPSACRKKLLGLRWPNNFITCPQCQHNEIYRFADRKRFKCKGCSYKFNVTTGTFFEGSKIPLNKWFVAIYLASSHKKGISSCQLARDIGVTQKTAYFMIARIQKSFANVAVEVMDQTVEVDETYVGGKNKNRHYNKRHRGKYIRGRGSMDKIKVFGMLERESGNVRSTKVPSVGKDDLLPIIRKHVAPGATICSDEYSSYESLSWHNSGYRHLKVDHSAYLYANGENHTNTLEGYWAIGIKRMIMGVHHSFSEKHINRYLSGADFRYNTRFMTEAQRFDYILANSQGRLTYRQLIQK